ncbi:hypothetical protein VP01_6324g1, partial [Puccinia sorghi]
PCHDNTSSSCKECLVHALICSQYLCHVLLALDTCPARLHLPLGINLETKIAALEISLKDLLSSLPTLNGDNNCPMWSKRVTAFLRHKELFATITVNPGPNPNT